MYVADMHCDTAVTLWDGGSLINGYNFSERHPQLQFTAVFTAAKGYSPEERRSYALKTAYKISAECKRLGIAEISTASELYQATEQGRRSALLSLEGGGGLFADSPELITLYQRGLRVLGLVWDSNELGESCTSVNDTGLTEAGISLALKCAEMGIIVDISHISERSFWQLCRLNGVKLVATHSNFREVADSKRNLSRDMAAALKERGGIVGLSLYPHHLSDKGYASIDDILRHIDYGIEHFGEDFIGFGLDIDGVGGEYPAGIDESGSIHDTVLDRLLKHYSEGLVTRLAGGNAIDFLHRSLSKNL